MPLSVSNLSLRLLEESRLTEEAVPGAQWPVYVESRLITGYWPALELKRLISEREDLSYIGKLTRNADVGPVPGFTFIREGAESLNEYIRTVEVQQKAAAAASPATSQAEAS